MPGYFSSGLNDLAGVVSLSPLGVGKVFSACARVLKASDAMGMRSESRSRLDNKDGLRGATALLQALWLRTCTMPATRPVSANLNLQLMTSVLLENVLTAKEKCLVIAVCCAMLCGFVAGHYPLVIQHRKARSKFLCGHETKN